VQIYLLEDILPSILFPLLIALVAVLGSDRWRRTIVILTSIALLFLVLGVLTLRVHYLSPDSSRLQFVSIFVLPTIATSVILCGLIIETIGIFLALVLSARSRHWGWFTTLLIAAVISTLAGPFVTSYLAFYIFFGLERAQELFTAPLYAVITTILAGLAMVAQLLYALIDPKTTIAVTTAVAPESG
jgi:hypothetical protein